MKQKALFSKNLNWVQHRVNGWIGLSSLNHTSKILIFCKQLRRPIWDCGGWVPKTSWSYHYWQPAPRWRPHWWLAKPDNPAMSPHTLDKTGTRHTDTQWKVKGGEGREQNLLNNPHIQLLLPAPLMNKPYGPEHKEFHACASILIPLTNWL